MSPMAAGSIYDPDPMSHPAHKTGTLPIELQELFYMCLLELENPSKPYTEYVALHYI
jgi:hypothetical protein